MYDCGCTGSKPYLNNAVILYKRLAGINKSKKIHLLILSHLHADHINGLSRLLEGGVQVDTMVIPYFSEDSKQLARIGSDRRDRFLQNFYDNPFDLPVRRIIIIGAPENERSEGVGENFNIDADEPSGSGQIFTGNNAVIKYGGFWEFSLENMPFPQSEINTYVQWLLAQGNGRTLSDLLQDRNFVKNLRTKTQKTFHAPCAHSLINRTSVMMLHKPIAKGLHRVSCGSPLIDIDSFYEQSSGTLYDSCCETLLTGDVELYCSDSSTVIDGIQRQNRELLVLQYPHHGGYCGCACRFLNLRARRYIISYGLTNTYGHPNLNVISSLPPMHTVHVNEARSFSYQIIT